ncbi:hypothetical protein BVY04_04250 [bacterium M21]|nr:hypothetical protein BVY04_04250 [bacterium M21]
MVEHIIAELYAMNIVNAIIALDGPEPPVGDGSSLPYVELLQKAGVVEQDAPAEFCRIETPIWVEKDDSRLIFLPHDEDTFRITCTVHYGVCKMDTQYLSLEINEETFTKELAPARTFCEDYAQVEFLMKAGLIRGASLDNAMVVRDGAIISKDGLRFDDELVRHKMLDIVGDLSLIGRRLRGHLIAIKPGHPLNVEMAQTLMKAMGYES